MNMKKMWFHAQTELVNGVDITGIYRSVPVPPFSKHDLKISKKDWSDDE